MRKEEVGKEENRSYLFAPLFFFDRFSAIRSTLPLLKLRMSVKMH